MTRLADDGQQGAVVEELRQEIVLDLARDPLLAGAVTVRHVDLPVVVRHHLVGDARAIR